MGRNFGELTALLVGAPLAAGAAADLYGGSPWRSNDEVSVERGDSPSASFARLAMATWCR